MPLFADLHSHSTASDGLYEPADVVRRAVACGLGALALSDHDSIGGLAAAAEAAASLPIELVAGVEISAGDEPAKDRFGLHILGLFIDPTHPDLVAFLEQQAAGRTEQKLEQIRRFQQLGLRIDPADLFARAAGVPGKPHLVAALLELNPDAGLTPEKLYNEYFAPGGPAYVERDDEPSADTCIQVIHAAGGLAFLAHPLYYRTRDLSAMIANLDGLDGIEIDAPYELNPKFAGPSTTRQRILAPLLALANSNSLLITGGSDFHGGKIGGPLGSAGLTRRAYRALCNAAAARASSAA